MAEPGAATIILRPLYDGRPVEGLQRQAVRVRLREEQTGAWLSPEARVWNGFVELSPVQTGIYWASAALDLDPRGDLGPNGLGLPGDLVSDGITVQALRDGEAVTVDLPLKRVLRLREPEDTQGVWDRADPPHVSSPIRFAWDAVPGALRYEMRIEAWPVAAPGMRHEIARATSTAARWSVNVPPTRSGESYSFALHAFGETGELGELRVESARAHALAFDFVVDDPETMRNARRGVWLMVPPVVGPDPDVGSPLRKWCAYAEFDDAAACEHHLARLTGGSIIGFRGSRCMAAFEVGRPSRHERVLRSISVALGIAAGFGSRVGTPADLGVTTGDPPAALIVASASGSVVLAVDVVKPDDPAMESVIAARAAAGVPEYWRVVLGDPDHPTEMYDSYSKPYLGHYQSSSGRGVGGDRDRDRTVVLVAMPGATVTLGAILPPLCETPPERTAAPAPAVVKVPPGCGDGEMAGAEECDDGDDNGRDGCCDVTCRLVDADHDGVCDARDPCVNVDRLFVRKPALTLTGRRHPRLYFTGEVDVGSRVDPGREGFRLVLTDASGATVLDATIPGGVGWATTADGARFHDDSGRSGGVTAVAVTHGDDLVQRVEVRGRVLRAASRSPSPPAKAIVAFDTVNGRRGRCAEARFPAPRCGVAPHDRSVRCSTVPFLAPCEEGGTDAVLGCAALRVALAQEAEWDRNRAYEAGPCTDLPGVTMPESVLCTTNGTATTFAVTVVNAADGAVCQWQSRPARLECRPAHPE